MHSFKIRIGKVLIAFSFVILAFGFSFQINSKQDVLVSNIPTDGESQNNPIVIDDSNDTTKPITDNNQGTNSGNGTITSIPNTSNPIVNNGDNNSNDNGVVNSNGNTNNPITPPATIVTPQPVIPETQNPIDKTNLSLRKEIENTYGITVKYGTETSGYMVGGLDTVSCINQNVINNALKKIKNDLSLYPTNFFKELRSTGLPLSIYLIQRYSTANVTGITEKGPNGVIISISLDFPFSDTFHHENYHYIEHVITQKGGSYTNWNNYNPTGFSYGVYNYKYVFTENGYLEDSYFVNTYAQTYEYEDRASTFEYMMADSKISPLNYGKNIWLKAKVMCETIDYYFNTVTPNTTEYWERFVYN